MEPQPSQKNTLKYEGKYIGSYETNPGIQITYEDSIEIRNTQEPEKIVYKYSIKDITDGNYFTYKVLYHQRSGIFIGIIDNFKQIQWPNKYRSIQLNKLEICIESLGVIESIQIDDKQTNTTSIIGILQINIYGIPTLCTQNDTLDGVEFVECTSMSDMNTTKETAYIHSFLIPYEDTLNVGIITYNNTSKYSINLYKVSGKQYEERNEKRRKKRKKKDGDSEDNGDVDGDSDDDDDQEDEYEIIQQQKQKRKSIQLYIANEIKYINNTQDILWCNELNIVNINHIISNNNKILQSIYCSNGTWLLLIVDIINIKKNIILKYKMDMHPLFKQDKIKKLNIINTIFQPYNHIGLIGTIQNPQSSIDNTTIVPKFTTTTYTDKQIIEYCNTVGTTFLLFMELKYYTIIGSYIYPSDIIDLRDTQHFNTVISSLSSPSSLLPPTPIPLKEYKLNIQNYNKGIIIFTRSYMYIHEIIVYKSSLYQIIGKGISSSTFFYIPKNININDELTISTSKVCKLLSTPAPFINDTKKLLSTTSQEQLKFDINLLYQIQDNWKNYIYMCDSTERAILLYLFPSMKTLFSTQNDDQDKKSYIIEIPDTETLTVKDFLHKFFTSISTTGIFNTHNNDKSYIITEKSEIGYKSWIDLIHLVYTYDIEKNKYKKEIKDVQLVKPISPLFVAIISRYCYSKLQNNIENTTKEKNLLYVYPLRIQIASHSISIRYLPGQLSYLCHLQLWDILNESLLCIYDIHEYDIVVQQCNLIFLWANYTRIYANDEDEDEDDDEVKNVLLQDISITDTATTTTTATTTATTKNSTNYNDNLLNPLKSPINPLPQIRKQLRNQFQIPICNETMENEIKKVDFTNILLILRYIHILLCIHLQNDNSINIDIKKIVDKYISCNGSIDTIITPNLPSIEQLQKWITIIINSHFVQFISIKNINNTSNDSTIALKLLKDIQYILSKLYIPLCYDTVPLYSLIHDVCRQMSTGVITKAPIQQNRYSLQVLYL